MAGLVKAQLGILKNSENQTDKPEFEQASGGQANPFVVQFNPENLKVSYSNQVVPPEQSGNTSGHGRAAAPTAHPTAQFVGRGNTKLSVQLIFDVTGDLSEVDRTAAKGDVRRLTMRVANLIKPSAITSGNGTGQFIPPKVRFVWGSFRFDGIVESLEESLEFFSPEGLPLRAVLSLSLVQQEFQFDFEPSAAPNPSAANPGTRPLTAAGSGSNLPGMVSNSGRNDWQGVAQANNIENPRRLEPGRLIDLNARK
jgi:Contractile injection system tube protein